MNKKASSIIMMIFEVLVVILVIGMALKISNGYSQSETIEKITTAQDMVMMIHALVGMPGNAIVEYPDNETGYSFAVDNKKVIVFTSEDSELQKRSQTVKFYLPTDYQAEGFLEDAARVCLRKSDKKITLEACNES